MLRVGDNVRIRATHVHCVRGYQIKALGYKRLTGRVAKLNGTGALVDFTQNHMPVGPNGYRPGERVSINKSSKLRRADGFFPLEMLEPSNQ